MTTTHETRIFAGVTLIDTPVIFGALIASKIPAYESVDFEVHAVSAILHDLAWDCTSVFATNDKRFEVDSANAAREYLKREVPEFDQRQLQMVWDSIALHTTPSIAQHKEMEVALCQMGITGDFFGSGLPGGLITKEEHSAVVKELPLLDLKNSVKKLLCALCKHKPETTYDNFVRDFGERFVDGYSMESKSSVDIVMRPLD